MSQVSATKREKRTVAEALSIDRVTVRQLEFDYTVPVYLESVDPASYDNVVLLASEQLKSGAESDARTILGYLLLRDLMTAEAAAPSVLVELTDLDNVTLFENRRGEVIVSPVIVSHMLARVALRRELRAVIDELFSSAGCEILFRHIADYGLVPGEYSFADLQRAADTRGEIAIGIQWVRQDQIRGGGVQLNPRSDEHLKLNENDKLVVLTTDE